MRLAVGPPPVGKASGLASLLLAGVLAGCAAEAPQAPGLANPKVLVDRDARNMTHVYVNSAFGDRLYERIVVRVDNRTEVEANDSYAVDVRVAATALELGIDVRGVAANWTLRALVRLPASEDDDAEIALWDADEETYGAYRGTGLPWLKILDEVPEPEADAAQEETT